MNDVIRVTEDELLAVVERGDREELERYFLIEQPTPFDIELRLRPDVVVDGTEEEGPFASIVLGAANTLARRSRKRRYRKQLEERPDWLRVVSEGDSWFQHPLVTDTIDHLFSHVNLLSLGAAGDVLTRMFEQGEYRRAIEDEKPRVFMLSGGGNDMMGGQFGDYLRDAPQAGTNPGRFLNERFHLKLQNLLRIYEGIFAELDQRFSDLLVLCHGYDYVQPGEGKKGRWLGRPMEDHRIDDPSDKQALIRFIIDNFNDRLAGAAAPFSRVRYVDMRGVVGRDQWYDEIHPDAEGFQQVALRFYDAMLQET